MALDRHLAPLLGDAELPEETGKPQPNADFIKREHEKRKLNLLFYTGLLLASQVGNAISWKKMVSAMPNYAYFLTVLTTCVYIPGFAILAGSNIYKQARKDLLVKFLVAGIFDGLGLSGVLGLLSSIKTSGTRQTLLQQLVIPIAMVCSVAYMGKQYHWLQQTAAAVIVIGVFVVNADGGKSDPTVDDPIFNVMFVMATVPTAVSSVLKEGTLRSEGGKLDTNALQFWVRVSQLVTTLSAVFIYTLPVLGDEQVPLSDMPHLMVAGSKCLFLREDQIRDDCGQPGLRPCDTCKNAWLPISAYLIITFVFNIATVGVINHGSAALTFLVGTLQLPLTAVAFSSRFVMGRLAMPLG